MNQDARQLCSRSGKYVLVVAPADASGMALHWFTVMTTALLALTPGAVAVAGSEVAGFSLGRLLAYARSSSRLYSSPSPKNRDQIK
jgi:hypothetical protein